MPSIPGASSLTVPAEGSVGLSSHLMMPWEDWLESNFNLGFCGLVTSSVGGAWTQYNFSFVVVKYIICHWFSASQGPPAPLPVY